MDHGRRWGLRGKMLAWPLCRPQQRPHPLHRSWRDFPDAKFVVAVAFSNLALIHEYVCRKTCLKFLLSKGHKCFTHQPRLAQVYKTAMCKFFEQGTCTKGANCTFAHGVEELQVPVWLERKRDVEMRFLLSLCWRLYSPGDQADVFVFCYMSCRFLYVVFWFWFSD